MRNTIEIHIWMKRNGWSVTRIQRELGFKAHVMVSNTINGKWNNRMVLRLLLNEGCPAELLHLPGDMMEAA